MTDFITEEMVEKAARAAYERQYPGGHWGASCLADDFKDNARAALTAALPLIVERCAKEAETQVPGFITDYAMRDRTPTEIAARIRSLLPTTTKEG
jgi:hypothetical protein